MASSKPKKAAKGTKKTVKKVAKKPVAEKPSTGVTLLSGGNPQIPKGDGDAPVQAYIAAMPGWKHKVGKNLDTLIVRTIPHVHKAVKWNSPFFGFMGEGWFLSYHCFTKFVRVTFFQGASLSPVPPGASKIKNVRYFDIYEEVEFDEAQFINWVTQASTLPREKM